MQELALRHFAGGNFEKAEPLLKKLVRINPEAAEMHQLLGYCHLARGERERAAYQFQRVLEAGRANAETLYYLGRLAEFGIRPVARPQGPDRKNAAGLFRKALEEDPLHIGTLNHLGTRGVAPLPPGPVEAQLAQKTAPGVHNRFFAYKEIIAVESRFLFWKKQRFVRRDEMAHQSAKRIERDTGWVLALLVLAGFAILNLLAAAAFPEKWMAAGGILAAVFSITAYAAARRARSRSIIIYNSYTAVELLRLRQANPTGEAVEEFLNVILSPKKGTAKNGEPPSPPYPPKVL
jgi:tetratricopeptide (TPR) repeat protein